MHAVTASAVLPRERSSAIRRLVIGWSIRQLWLTPTHTPRCPHNIRVVLLQNRVVLLQDLLQLGWVLGSGLLEKSLEPHNLLVVVPKPIRQPLQACMCGSLIASA